MLLTEGCKCLINKGMFNDKVSSGRHTLDIPRTPPPPFMGVYGAHIERVSKRFFGLYWILVFKWKSSGKLITCLCSRETDTAQRVRCYFFFVICGFGGARGLLTSTCLQPCLRALNTSFFSYVDLGGLGGIFSPPIHPGGFFPPAGACGGLRHA